MREWLEAVFVPCEGLALVQTMKAWNEQDWPQLELLDAELTALKPASETRKSSATLGSRLLKTALPLFPETNLKRWRRPSRKVACVVIRCWCRECGMPC